MEEKEEIKQLEITPEVFFGVLVSAGTISHIKHLQVEGEGSFAAHKALNKFYDEVVEIADAVIETYQGWKKQIVQYDADAIIAGLHSTPMEYLEGMRAMVEESRYDIIPKEQSHIHNELDNLVTLIDGTIYKLTFLK
jgi:hypothetical protein